MMIDARGKGCPGPVLLADNALLGLGALEIEVLVDSEESAQALRDYAAQNGMSSVQSRDGNGWSVRIVRNDARNAAPARSGAGEAGAPPKGLLLVVGTDALGREEALGRILMQGFLETMKVTREVPHTLFFLNAGVRLTTGEGPEAALLRAIEQLGTEIYSCGSCLRHYGLESSLKVGKRGTTSMLVEGLQDFAKVVWV